jgi:hypothetical protein
MDAELIQGRQLVEEFLALMPKVGAKKVCSADPSQRTGNHHVIGIPFDLQLKLPSIFLANEFMGSQYRELFNGDTTAYGNDHSVADMAFVGYMARQGLTADEMDFMFRASGLYRDKWDEMRGAATYGQMTIAKAFEGLPIAPDTHGYDRWWNTSDLNRYRPEYVSGGMPARKFVGPKIGPGVRLFPAAALSALVALGAVGKTSLLVSIGVHVAAGKDWNGHPVEQHKVAIFFCEEIKLEINRKFSAIVDGWSTAERQKAAENIMLVPLVGDDARLTKIYHGQYQNSGVTEKMITLLDAFGLKDGLVVIDHMQGFASGDLNTSETATSICREANKIVQATGAAVVFAAHISKANIKATELEQGFAVGSLAFENATRQMVGMLPMPVDEAKKYGLEAHRNQYAWLGLPKNSYGGTDAGVWLKKELVPNYHTVVMAPVELVVPISGPRKSANEKLADRIVDYLRQYPLTSKNQLDRVAGEDGVLRASKGKIRDVLGGLLDTGVIETHSVTEAERQQHDIPKQVKEILTVKALKPTAKPAKPAGNQVAQAGLKPLVEEP